MKALKLIMSILIILMPLTGIAQEKQEDVIYLKNGSIIRGTILETIPEKSVKIQTKDGNILVYNMGDIERIAKEDALIAEQEKEGSKSTLFKNGLSYIGGGLSLIKLAKNNSDGPFPEGESGTSLGFLAGYVTEGLGLKLGYNKYKFQWEQPGDIWTWNVAMFGIYGQYLQRISQPGSPNDVFVSFFGGPIIGNVKLEISEFGDSFSESGTGLGLSLGTNLIINFVKNNFGIGIEASYNKFGSDLGGTFKENVNLGTLNIGAYLLITF